LVAGLSALVALPFGGLGGVAGGAAGRAASASLLRSVSVCSIEAQTVAAGSLGGIAAHVAGGAVAGASGDLAAQALNIALGQQDRVHWSQVGLSAGLGALGGAAHLAVEGVPGG